MIWLVWRQHRTVLAVSVAGIVALVVWMVVVQHDYATARSALARCPSFTPAAVNSTCPVTEHQLLMAADQAAVIRGLLLAVPVVLGVLLGAPLVAGDLEHDTAILTFTQGISRLRWLAARWLLVAVALLVLVGGLAAYTDRWFGAVQTHATAGILLPVVSRIRPGTFDVTGVVPAAYALFAFALAAALGALLRRIFWAGLLTVPLFVAARVSFEHFFRPWLAAARFVPLDLTGGNGLSRSGSLPWYFGTGYQHRPGSPFPASQSYVDHVVDTVCRPYQTVNCLVAHGVQYGQYLQPASNYWPLQWGEAIAFVEAAALLFLLATWAVNRWRA